MSRKNAKRANRPNPRVDRNMNKGENIIQIANFRKNKVEIIPRSINQDEFLDYLENDNINIVFGIGPAGSGKTLLSTMMAIKMFKEGKVDKMIITRPAVSVDEKHGFLPGDLNAKLEPWLLPILDVFKEYYSQKEIDKMIEEGILEFASLGFMRGRTFKNAIIIADECQNSTPNQMKMILTRIGENSKMVITGDLEQYDRTYENNGLKDFIERISTLDLERIKYIKFDNSDIQRHPVIQQILDIYEI